MRGGVANNVPSPSSIKYSVLTHHEQKGYPGGLLNTQGGSTPRSYPLPFCKPFLTETVRPFRIPSIFKNW